MTNFVYKSEEGRSLVEMYYRKLIEGISFLNPQQLFIESEQGRTHVLRFGDPGKDPLIMLHGSCSNSACWFGHISSFTDRFCVYCIDIPGEPGLSDPFRFSLSSANPELWLKSIFEYLDIESVSFLTISLGSWYAMNFAVRNPQKVAALSMLTVSGIVPAKTSFIFKSIFFMMLGKTGQKLLNRALYYKTDVPDEVLDFQAVVSKNFIPLTEAIPLFSDIQLNRITSPVQFFGGDHDCLLNTPGTATRLQKLCPKNDIRLLKETGHVIIDCIPEIKEFLTACRSVYA